MPNLIQLKRGNKNSIPTLKPGEPGFCLDSKDLYVGDGTLNTRFVKESEVVRASTSEATTATDAYKIMTPKTVKDAFDSYGKAEVSTALASAKTYTDTKVAALVNGAPGVLDTLKELSDALGGDANFATTVSNQIATKADKNHGNHVPATETASNSKFLRNDNTWQTVTPSNIGAVAPTGTIVAGRVAAFNDTTGKVIKDSGYTIAKSVPSNAVFTDTTYVAGTGMALSGTTFNHKNAVTAGTAQGDSNKTLAFGGTFLVPTVTYDAQGHITGKGTTTMTMPAAPTSVSGNAGTATKLATARSIALGNQLSGSANFDGSSNITISANINYINIASGNLNTYTTDGWYRCASQGASNLVTGKPSDTADVYNGFTLKVERMRSNGNTDSTVKQTFSTNTATWIRIGTMGTSTTWESWRQLAYTNSSITGNAASATKLQTARSINGTNFDGTGNITTANWGTARTLTIGNSGKSVNGSGNVSWTLAEIGASATGHTHSYLPLSGGTLTGLLTLSGNPTSNLHAATKQYVDSILGSNDAMVYKGSIDASTNPNFPAASCGYTYKISVAGRVGGASGVKVEVGDMIICLKDSSAAGDNATVGTNWNVIQANVDGAVTGPASSVDNRIATFSGTGGKVIKDSGYTIATSVPSGAVFTDTRYTAGSGLALSGTTFNHASSITAGTAQGDATKSLSFGGTFTIPTVTYNATGHITAKGTTTMTMPAAPTSVSGNAGSATILQTARTINGTSFNGSSNITTANWGTARTLTIGNSGKSVNGSANISYSLSEIGAVPVAGGTITGNLTVNGNVTVGQKVKMQYNTTTESLDFIFS